MGEKRAVVTSAVWTPAAAAYSANDVISVAQQLLIAPLLGGVVEICSTRLVISETALQASEAAYNLHLYNVTPPSAHADNAAWDLPAGDRASYLGMLALGTPVDIGSSLVIEVNNIGKLINVPGSVGGGVIWAELVTVGGATLTATARTVYVGAKWL
jgi:hypothetical protein